MNRYKLPLLLLILLLMSALWMNVTIPDFQYSEQIQSSHHKVYEMRTYTTFDGKLDDLHKRFADHTMALFEKHGMENIGYFTPMERENTLIYIIAHKSREAAEKSWDAFVNDPEWQEAYQASRADGPLVENIESVFMTNTEFSPMK